MLDERHRANRTLTRTGRALTACRNIGERLVSMLGWSEWSIVLFFP